LESEIINDLARDDFIQNDYPNPIFTNNYNNFNLDSIWKHPVREPIRLTGGIFGKNFDEQEEYHF